MKKKQQIQNESVDLAPSRTSRSWSSRLLKILKIKSRRSHNGNHDDRDDASVDSISGSPQCSGVNEEAAVYNAPVHGQLDQVSTIEEEPIAFNVESCHCASHSNSIMSACSSSDLTSVTEVSNSNV